MSDERKKLIWKYFWEQKKEEVENIFLFIGFCYLMIGWFIGIVYFILSNVKDNGSGGIDYVNNLTGYIPMILWIIFTFLIWIYTNWEKAGERVDEELEKKEKVK